MENFQGKNINNAKTHNNYHNSILLLAFKYVRFTNVHTISLVHYSAGAIVNFSVYAFTSFFTSFFCFVFRYFSLSLLNIHCVLFEFHSIALAK